MCKIKTSDSSEDMAIEIPLVNIKKEDVYGALFVHMDSNAHFSDALMDLQTWIMNYTEEVIQPLRESGRFTEEYIEDLKRKTCVISPLTLTLYLHCLQMDQFAKMSDSEKERVLLGKIPDRFRARYKSNAACRNARDVSPEEENDAEGGQSESEVVANKRRMSFVDFLKEFGEEVRRTIAKCDKSWEKPRM